jgi:hypothetical protein
MAIGKVIKGGKKIIQSLRKPISIKENLGRSVTKDVIAPSGKGIRTEKHIPETFRKTKLGTDASKIKTALKRLRNMTKKKNITNMDHKWKVSTSKRLARGKTTNTTALIRILEARLKKIKELMHKNLAKKVKESGGEKSLHGKIKQFTKKEIEEAGYNVARKHGGQIGTPRGTGAALRGFGKGYKKD